MPNLVKCCPYDVTSQEPLTTVHFVWLYLPIYAQVSIGYLSKNHCEWSIKFHQSIISSVNKWVSWNVIDSFSWLRLISIIHKLTKMILKVSLQKFVNKAHFRIMRSIWLHFFYFLQFHLLFILLKSQNHFQYHHWLRLLWLVWTPLIAACVYIISVIFQFFLFNEFAEMSCFVIMGYNV